MRLPLGKSFACSSSMDVSSQTAGFFRAVSQRVALLSVCCVFFFYFQVWFFFIIIIIHLFYQTCKGNRFHIHLRGEAWVHCRTLLRGRHSSGCVRNAWFLGILFFILFCLFCMHGWHGAVVLFLQHLITIDIPRLNKMFFYLVKECSWLFFFFLA